HHRVCVADEDRAPRRDPVDVAVAVLVLDPRARGGADEARLAADVAEGAHRTVHAAGNDLARALHEALGGPRLHAGSAPGAAGAGAASSPPSSSLSSSSLATDTTRSPSAGSISRTPWVLRLMVGISETRVRIITPPLVISMISSASETCR